MNAKKNSIKNLVEKKQAIAEIGNSNNTLSGTSDLLNNAVSSAEENAVWGKTAPNTDKNISYNVTPLTNSDTINTQDNKKENPVDKATEVMQLYFPQNDFQHCVFIDNEGTAAAVVKVREEPEPQSINLMVIVYSSYSGSFTVKRYTKDEIKALKTYLYKTLNLREDKFDVPEFVSLFGELTYSFILKNGKLIKPFTEEIYSDLSPIMEGRALDMLNTAKENDIPVNTVTKKFNNEKVEYYAINKAALEEADSSIDNLLPLLAMGGYIYYWLSNGNNKHRYSARIKDAWSSEHARTPDKVDKREPHILIRKDMLSPDKVASILGGNSNE